MHSKHMIIFIFASLVLVTSSGCATIFSGPFQDIQIVTEPPCEVYINGYMSHTPTAASLEKGATHEIILRKEGYHEMIITVRPEKLNYYCLGNLLTPAYIGFLIDWATGSVYYLTPANIYARLKPIEEGREPPPQSPDRIEGN